MHQAEDGTIRINLPASYGPQAFYAASGGQSDGRLILAPVRTPDLVGDLAVDMQKERAEKVTA